MWVAGHQLNFEIFRQQHLLNTKRLITFTFVLITLYCAVLLREIYGSS